MGLDQYAAIRLDTKNEHGEWDTEELAYWRKHPNLQGFMENLWEEKGRPNIKPEQEDSVFGSDFNCVDLELTLEDIDTLEASVKGEELPETGGFFFGDCNDEHYKEEDLQFCKDAREALFFGQTVVYSSWW
tara:strand:+ start:140 stop:532 length:393 start_codon:yes stop_codon:yes gene_type:complete